MAGQVLRMDVNGRLTAPPELEAALVTNSVDGMVSESRGCGLPIRGTTLARISPGTGTQTREERIGLWAGGGAAFERGLWKLESVSAVHGSAAQGLSVSQEVAAGN